MDPARYPDPGSWLHALWPPSRRNQEEGWSGDHDHGHRRNCSAAGIPRTGGCPSLFSPVQERSHLGAFGAHRSRAPLCNRWWSSVVRPSGHSSLARGEQAVRAGADISNQGDRQSGRYFEGEETRAPNEAGADETAIRQRRGVGRQHRLTECRRAQYSVLHQVPL
jgi:hypothetical protein